MFCPNCASPNDEPQHYCRTCGLQLDGIAASLALQKPSPELAALLKRKRRAQKLGILSLSTAGVIGLMLVLSIVFYYKLLLFGPELLFGATFGALTIFLLASLSFLSYSKFFIKMDRINEQPSGEPADPATFTNKLLNDPPFVPASVTEQTTELLRRKFSKRN